MKRKKKKALLEFRCKVEDSILGNYLLGKPNKNLSSKGKSKLRDQLREITLWGVPLLPSKCHEGTDIILLKFLKAKDFKVHEAFEMLRKTLKWRKEYDTDSILEEDFDPDLEKVMFMDTQDRQGHPLYYNIYGALKDRKLYQKLFGTEEKCKKFLRLRVQFMEMGIKKLNFKAGGADSIIQITDLKNSPGPGSLRSIGKKALMLIQDNYPELIHKNILINVPFWLYASHALTSRLITPRTNSKFVFARPSEVTKTLLKYISPENLLIEYGGLRRENDEDFFPHDKASELVIRKSSAGCIQFPATEVGITMVWEVTVVGWDVSYKEVFVPADEGSYSVHFQNNKEKKTGGEKSIRNSFYISEPGKIVITIDNASFKKKMVFYRYKAKPTVPMYIFIKES